MPTFCPATDSLEKLYQAGHDGEELQKNRRDWSAEFLRLNSRKPEPESKPAADKVTVAQKPEPPSVEEFFGDEKRSSNRGTVKLTKRLVDGEIMVEHWNHEGECINTTFISADAVDEGSPLAKSEIMSQMNKTLSEVRASLAAEEFAAAERAIKALDIPCFLEIVRRAQVAA